MNILFFDCETNGLPKDYRAEISDVDNWPRVVQLATTIVCTDTESTLENVFIIRPDGWQIGDDTVSIHGITQDRAEAEGLPIDSVLTELSMKLADVDLIVAHNVSFDRKVIGAEFLRAGMPDWFHGKPRICTMMKSTRYCNLPGKRGPKWPKLEELAGILFGEAPSGLHDAREDVRVTVKCFFELRRLGVISDADIQAAIDYQPATGF